MGYLYDENFKYLNGEHTGGDGVNFLIRRKLEAGKTYYIGVGLEYAFDGRDNIADTTTTTLRVEGETKPPAEMEDTPEKWEEKEEAKPVKIETLKLDYTKLTLAKGRKFKLSCNVTPLINDDTITWTSSNPKYVTVNKNGVIKAIKEGKNVAIRAMTSDGLVATCVVKVPKKEIKAESVQVKKSKVSLDVGKQYKMKVTKKPKNSTDNLTYSSKNEKVAVVDSKGTITATGKGKTKITVKTTSGKKATVTVVVK